MYKNTVNNEDNNNLGGKIIVIIINIPNFCEKYACIDMDPHMEFVEHLANNMDSSS